MKYLYRRTFRRTVNDGNIIYAGFKYTSDELKKIKNGTSVFVTKFGNETGTFDISKLVVDTNDKKAFWVS